jgi:hypothetical protein
MNSVSGLDKRLQEVLTRPEFLEMRGVAKEVPIFIQTYGPADEDQLRVKPVDLLELVLQLLEAKGYLDVVLQEEASWSRSDLFDTLQNVAEPTAALVPKLITGSGRVYPFLRTHTILEALQPAMVRHPVVIFFPGEYSQDADGGSYLRLFGTSSGWRPWARRPAGSSIGGIGSACEDQLTGCAQRLRLGSCKRSERALVTDLGRFDGHVARFRKAFPRFANWQVEKVAIAPSLTTPETRRAIQTAGYLPQSLDAHHPAARRRCARSRPGAGASGPGGPCCPCRPRARRLIWS